MRARIDISEVEASTKIRAKYLRALENEEWDLLPGPVYVKSFLKTYGEFLGLDSRLLIDEFKRRYERPADHELRAVSTTAREHERRRKAPGRARTLLFSPRSAIGLALVAIVVALYVIGSQGGKQNGNRSNITPATTTGNGHHHTHTGSDGTTTTTGTTTTAPPPRNATLTLVPTGTVWVCVENQAGKALVRGVIYTAGQTIPTTRAPVLLITLGNTHVTMTVNGRPYAPTGSNAISLKITPTRISPLSPAPTCGQ